MAGNEEVSLERLPIVGEEDDWVDSLSSIINSLPVTHSNDPVSLSVQLRECPLPRKESIILMTRLYGLSGERVRSGEFNAYIERNICITLGYFAAELAGPISVAILTHNTLEYLVACLGLQSEPSLILFALIALEKFAQSFENKLKIEDRIRRLEQNPVLELETHLNSEDYLWRQIGFCATWALDNYFVVEGRKLSYEVVDMTDIRAVLNTQDATRCLQISSTGLEARCDRNNFESVKCTCEVNEGCWYYEVTLITDGVMLIGWATSDCDFENDSFSIGGDRHSISYDGCRSAIWYNSKPTYIRKSSWKPGDVLGCLIDIDGRFLICSMNGKRLVAVKDIFQGTRHGIYAAASLSTFQQCRFNFGNRPFKFPPNYRQFSTFNEHGVLTEEQKLIIPQRLKLQQLRLPDVNNELCTVCYDKPPSSVLEPCGHSGFCASCTSRLTKCPLCRAKINNVREDNK